MIISQLKFQFLISVGIFKSSFTKITLRKPLFCCKTRQNVFVRYCHAFDKDDDEVNILDVQKPGVQKLCIHEKFSSVKRLSEGLNCNEDEAEKMLQDNPKLRNITANNLTKRCEFLAERNISTGIIINHPWLLIGDKSKLRFLSNKCKSLLAS